jgi:hypothetical protein
MLSFAYLVISFAELSTNSTYGLVRLIVSGFLMLEIYVNNKGLSRNLIKYPPTFLSNFYNLIIG